MSHAYNWDQKGPISPARIKIVLFATMNAETCIDNYPEPARLDWTYFPGPNLHKMILLIIYSRSAPRLNWHTNWDRSCGLSPSLWCRRYEGTNDFLERSMINSYCSWYLWYWLTLNRCLVRIRFLRWSPNNRSKPDRTRLCKRIIREDEKKDLTFKKNLFSA